METDRLEVSTGNFPGVYFFHPLTLGWLDLVSLSLCKSALLPFLCTFCARGRGGGGLSVMLPRPMLKNAVGADDLC
jgi:hypothetical protein